MELDMVVIEKELNFRRVYNSLSHHMYNYGLWDTSLQNNASLLQK